MFSLKIRKIFYFFIFKTTLFINIEYNTKNSVKPKTSKEIICFVLFIFMTNDLKQFKR